MISIGSVVMWRGDRHHPAETGLIIDERRAEGVTTRPITAYRIRFVNGTKSWVSVDTVQSLED